MTELHPLTEDILERIVFDSADTEELDQIVRARLDKEPVVVESGVRFVGLEDTTVEVAGTFIESGNQLQMALIGSEPVLLVQPNYDADENHITLILTAVDLPPEGLVQTLEVLLDGAKTVVAMQAEQAALGEPTLGALAEGEPGYEVDPGDIEAP